MINVLVWNEYLHERMYEGVGRIYPRGIHGCIAEFLGQCEDMKVNTVTLEDGDDALSEEVLSDTDVLIWWGHMAHDRVSDETVDRVVRHINGGMGFIPLHSAHHSKVMKRLCGTTCNLGWRNDDTERIWTVTPMHPIAQGIPEHFELPREEMYSEPFDIPNPDEVVFMGWFAGGEVFRSGVTFTRGGRIFYFQPGHEEYPTYHNETVQRVIINAVRWAAPVTRAHRCIPVENRERLPE